MAAALVALAAAATLTPAAGPASAAAAGSRPDPGPSPDIVGGTPGNVVYFTRLAGRNGDFCGGTAVGGDWILTAAHCMTLIPGGAILARVCPDCPQVTADEVDVHPLWDGNIDHGHDLALLHLPTGTVRGAIIPRVGAPWDPGAYAPGTAAEIMGYGRTCGNCPDSSVLMTADTTLVSDDDMDFMGAWTPSLMIGAGNFRTTTCFGDSGGPLVVHRNGPATQVGVLSFGVDGCGTASAFSELSGPQLAWVAAKVPQIPANWGTCIAADGLAGATHVHYATTAVAGDQGTDGPYHWQIHCDIIGVTVPNLLGRDEASARAAITGSDLTVGTVSHNNDCANPGNVETQNPSGGVVARRGSPVNITVSTCVTTGGGGGDTGGGGSGGGDRPPILPR